MSSFILIKLMSEQSKLKILKSIKESFRLGRLVILQTPIGCQEMSFICKTQWQNLTSLFLCSDCITDVEMDMLVLKQLPHLTALYLDKNMFTHMGLRGLDQPIWKFLISIDLSKNIIGSLGCMYITRPEWLFLERLVLNNCGLNNNAMLHLSKGDWPELQSLFFEQNNIGFKGMQYLIYGDWPKLKTLSVINYVENASIKFNPVLKLNCPQLTKLVLDIQGIEQDGTEHLQIKRKITINNFHKFLRDTNEMRWFNIDEQIVSILLQQSKYFMIYNKKRLIFKVSQYQNLILILKCFFESKLIQSFGLESLY